MYAFGARYVQFYYGIVQCCVAILSVEIRFTYIENRHSQNVRRIVFELTLCLRVRENSTQFSTYRIGDVDASSRSLLHSYISIEMYRFNATISLQT